MRIYFDADTIDDEMLKDSVTEKQIYKTSQYIEDLAESLNVDAENILKPTPFKVAELAEAYVLMETAKKQSMMNTNGAVEGADAYELKRRVYASEVSRLEAQITAETFTGGQSASRRTFPMSVKVYRG
jgi:hypothetical protein